MIKIENIKVYNFYNAMRGARFPMNGQDRVDSYFDDNGEFVFGEDDLRLARKLCIAGEPHRKFIRQIFVTMDITAPLYWWKEFDTYKIGVTANSTSTMHKIHSKKIEESDFSVDKLSPETMETFNGFVDYIEAKRVKYLETKDKKDWYEIIQLLPSSYNQMRACTMNYENLINMYEYRRHHKLDEWQVFCDQIEKMPYFMEMFDLNAGKEKQGENTER